VKRHHHKKAFSKQLTAWLSSTEWHFTTLLSISIESVNNIPDDFDHLINALLITFPEKPSTETLSRFIEKNQLTEKWFSASPRNLNIRSFNLDTIESTSKQSDQSLPTLESINELSDWLNIAPNELEWLANLKRQNCTPKKQLTNYHYHVIKKQRGGVRLIESPKSLLKEVQRKIHSQLLCRLQVHDAAHGFHTRRSILSHASVHTGKKN